MSLNKVILIGRVGTEPEIYNGESFKSAKFSFATSESFKNKQGEKVEKTQWHNIVIYGKLSDVVEMFVKKGDLLSIIGKIEYRSYESDNTLKYITEIKCDEMRMLGSGKRKDESTKEDQPNQHKENDSNDFQVGIDESDDLPF